MAESRPPNYTANSSFYHVFLDTYFEKQQESPSFQYLQKRHISSVVSEPLRVFQADSSPPIPPSPAPLGQSHQNTTPLLIGHCVSRRFSPSAKFSFKDAKSGAGCKYFFRHGEKPRVTQSCECLGQEPRWGLTCVCVYTHMRMPTNMTH